MERKGIRWVHYFPFRPGRSIVRDLFSSDVKFLNHYQKRKKRQKFKQKTYKHQSVRGITTKL